MKNIWYYDFPLGKIGIADENGFISRLFFGERNDLDGYELSETPLLANAAAQLSEYFTGSRVAFDLPLAPRGTAFQQSVWSALQTIKAGETRSYKEVAAQIGRPKATRAVGLANNRNPIAIIIPCHRVIGSDGGLTGYAGGLPIKQHLLGLENVQLDASAYKKTVKKRQ